MEKPLLVYIINLKLRSNRLESTLKELDKLNIPMQINVFEAITPDKARQLEDKFIDYNAYKNLRGNYNTVVIPTYGALGCAISHYKVWELAKKSPFTLVVEDDILISDPTQTRFAIQKVIKAIQINKTHNLLEPRHHYHDKRNFKMKTVASFYAFDPNYIYSNFEAHNNYSYNNYKKKTKQYIFGLNQPFTGTHFYILNDLAAILLTETLPPFQYQIDLEIGLYSKKYYNQFFLYGVKNAGVTQKKFASDVQYSFLEINKFKNALKHYPDKIKEKIYSFMPKKKNNNSYRDSGFYYYYH